MMPNHYRRVVFDDSSDISMLSLQGAADSSSTPQSPTVGSTSDCNMEQSIRDMSQALEDMSVREVEEGGLGKTTGSDLFQYEVEVKSEEHDGNSYVEDSFLVKDSDSEENASSAFECDELSAIGELPSPPVTRLTRSTKYAESTPLRTRPPKSANRTNNSLSILESFQDDESRRLMIELYPELLDGSTQPIETSAGESESKKSLGIASSAEENESSGKKERDSDSGSDGDEDSFHRYLKQLKGYEADRRSEEVNVYANDDLDDFIVDDDEPIQLEDDEGEISLKDVIPDCWRRPEQKHYEEKENEPTLYEYVPPKERKKMRQGLIKLFTEGTPVKEVLKESNRKPAKTKIRDENLDDEERFLMALSPEGPKHPEASRFLTSRFGRVREDLTKRLFDIYRRRCFDEKLDASMGLEWNARLRLTAGRCRCMRNGKASIELSVKVCNTAERVRDTLLHELCHAAVWVIDGIQNGGHGPAWKSWARRCVSVFRSLPTIERCHNYTIDAKFLYVCNGCGQTLKRHTKSFDTQRKICGVCRGRFELQRSDGKAISSQKKTNRFADFVKENYGDIRKPGMKHAEVMKILSLNFKQIPAKTLDTEAANEPEVETVDGEEDC